MISDDIFRCLSFFVIDKNHSFSLLYFCLFSKLNIKNASEHTLSMWSTKNKNCIYIYFSFVCFFIYINVPGCIFLPYILFRKVIKI